MSSLRGIGLAANSRTKHGRNLTAERKAVSRWRDRLIRESIDDVPASSATGPWRCDGTWGQPECAAWGWAGAHRAQRRNGVVRAPWNSFRPSPIRIHHGATNVTPCTLKLLVAAGARSVPERSGCDGERGSDDFMRLARFATAAGRDRPCAANHFRMHQTPPPDVVLA